ncbi:transposase, MuDR [Tanacetum coccineum]
MAPWPFFQWGIDVLGPLPEAQGKVKFVIVVVDYFRKWIEAKPLAKTTRKEVKEFVWDNIVCRPDGHPFDPYAVYSKFPSVFSLEIHHGGELSKAPDQFYDGWKVHWFDQIDSDGFSVVEVSHMLAGLGYVNPKMEYWYKMPDKDALLPISNDSDVLRFTKYVDRFKLMQLYVVHLVDKPKPLGDNENPKTEETFDLFFCDLDPDVGEPSKVPNVGEHNEVPNVGEPNEVPNMADQTEIPNDAEHSDGSEESDDSDDSMDLEDRIEEVEVDMANFRKYTDKNVEWVGPNKVPVEDTQPVEAEVFEDLDLEDFDSASDPDDIDSNRKKALKLLARKHKPVDGNIYSENFYCGQTFGNEELIKGMVSRLAVENRRQLWLSKNDKHAVACIWDMATNGQEPGIPESWVSECYWLSTWQEMYRFKINPYNGPDMWKKSPSPITLTPPDYHTLVGRPAKKRKKSAAELFDGMVKKGKLSRAGKSVTCTKCGQVGHNSRSCKGQRGPTVNQSQASQASASASARPSGNQSKALQASASASPRPSGNQPTAPFVTLRFTKNTTNRLSPIKKPAGANGLTSLNMDEVMPCQSLLFSGRPHCDVLINNMCEQMINKSNGPLTPNATKIFNNIKKEDAQCTVIWNGGDLYQATGPYGTQFKINPCNGPNMWKKLPSPITLTPPDYHTPVGRLAKKRKKSAAELFDGMVKKGKLSRAATSLLLQVPGPLGNLVKTSQASAFASPRPSGNQSQTSVTPLAPTVSQSQIFVRPTPHSIRQTIPFLRPTTPFVTLRFTKNITNRLSPIKKPAGANGKGKNCAGMKF